MAFPEPSALTDFPIIVVLVSKSCFLALARLPGPGGKRDRVLSSPASAVAQTAQLFTQNSFLGFLGALWLRTRKSPQDPRLRAPEWPRRPRSHTPALSAPCHSRWPLSHGDRAPSGGPRKTRGLLPPPTATGAGHRSHESGPQKRTPGAEQRSRHAQSRPPSRHAGSPSPASLPRPCPAGALRAPSLPVSGPNPDVTCSPVVPDGPDDSRQAN